MADESPRKKGGRPSRHPELGPAAGTAHVYTYRMDWEAYYADLRMRCLTEKQLSFSEWVMEAARERFAEKVRKGVMISCLDRTLIDLYEKRAQEQLRQDYDLYKSRQLAWIRANLTGLRKHWPELQPEEIFDELEHRISFEEATL
jgi:hypothetical protein